LKIAVDTTLFRVRCPSAESGFEQISKAGYRFIELNGGWGGYLEAHKATDEQISRLKEFLGRFGLEVCAVNVFGSHPLASPEETLRKAAVKNMIQVVKNTKSFGSELITSELPPSRAWTQFALDDPKVVEGCKVAFRKSIEELHPILTEEGVGISFECHPGDWIEDSDDTVDLLRETMCEKVGYLYCCPHTFLIGKDAVEMLEYAGKTLTHVHIADTHRAERMIPPSVVSASSVLLSRFRHEIHEHLIPGRGEIDFKKVFQALKKIGYKGFVSAIPFSHSDKPTEAAVETREKLEELLT